MSAFIHTLIGFKRFLQKHMFVFIRQILKPGNWVNSQTSKIKPDKCSSRVSAQASKPGNWPNVGGPSGPPNPPAYLGGLRPLDLPSSISLHMSPAGHDKCTMARVHVCTVAIVQTNVAPRDDQIGYFLQTWRSARTTNDLRRDKCRTAATNNDLPVIIRSHRENI